MADHVASSSGVVLAGAAAVGAYEVGVLRYLVTELEPDLQGPLFDVVCGTSAGAINAVTLAAFADRPAAGVRQLCDAWSALRIDQMLRPSVIELLSMTLDVTGAPRSARRAIRACGARGGLLDPAPIRSLVDQVPLDRIPAQLRTGQLRGIAISTTRVATGKAVVFYQAASPIPSWPSRNEELVEQELLADHVVASAAIPLLFPAVVIGSEAYCDGGLRQLVPLSPALRLGADRLLVINPLAESAAGDRVIEGARRAATTSPLYLAGKALNALFADRIEADLDRMAQVSTLLRAGRRRFGPAFEHELSVELASMGVAPLRDVEVLHIVPSRDLGALAAEYVASPQFAETHGAAGRVLRQIADGDPARAGNLLSYVLFDGGFASLLIELGHADARAQQAALAVLLAPRTDRELTSVVGA